MVLGCLLQPGLIRNQPPKSMRFNSFRLIKFYCIWTVPATETKSIGLLAFACGYGEQSKPTRELSCICPDMRSIVRGFCMPPRQLYRDMTNPAHLSEQRHLDNFIVTPNTLSLIGTLQKHMPTLTRTATQLNRRAVIKNTQWV